MSLVLIWPYNSVSSKCSPVGDFERRAFSAEDLTHTVWRVQGQTLRL